MKRKILIILILLFTFTGGYALATSVNGDFEGNPVIKLFSGGKELIVSDVPAINYKNRTLVPIYLLNQLGVKTVWDPVKQSVDIALPENTLSQDYLNRISESVFEVFSSKDDPTVQGQGTGFVINDVLISNYHLGGASAYVETKVADKLIKTTDKMFTNEAEDIMGIKMEGQRSLVYSTVLPHIGETVYAIGYPKGKFAISSGKVTDIYLYGGVQTIFNSAIIDNGSSGGALINSKGEVIGITTWSDKSGRNAAIPMMYVQNELDKPKK